MNIFNIDASISIAYKRQSEHFKDYIQGCAYFPLCYIEFGPSQIISHGKNGGISKMVA